MPAIDLVNDNVNCCATNWWSAKEKIVVTLPKGFSIRPLRADDYDRGYLKCLGQLTLVGEVSKQSFLERFNYMQKHCDTYMPVVIINEYDQVVACGTLLIERKFIHDCGMLAHIEDIVVDNDQRGKGLGRLLLEQLKHLAFKNGCYKITLDCDLKNEQFYEKTLFETKGLQMCIYYRDDPATTPESPKYPMLNGGEWASE